MFALCRPLFRSSFICALAADQIGAEHGPASKTPSEGPPPPQEKKKNIVLSVSVQKDCPVSNRRVWFDSALDAFDEMVPETTTYIFGQGKKFTSSFQHTCVVSCKWSLKLALQYDPLPFSQQENLMSTHLFGVDL